MFACIYIPNASGEAAAALLECASMFSPRVETVGAVYDRPRALTERPYSGTVVFDVTGLERLFGGYSQIAEKICDEVRAHGLEANIAIAGNADAAICAARGFGGITVIPRGAEAARLRDLPLAVLSPSLEISETLERWGIRTLGAFAKLPPLEVSERLGQEGVNLHKLAQGMGTRPIVPHVEAVRFVEVIDLDYEIHTIEPLTFILSRMLDQICSRMRSRNLATHEVRLALGNYVTVLNLPLPVRNARLLTRLFILDLEAHPPGASIQRVEVEAFPAKPRVVQNGLFVPLAPEPEKLQLTLARLKAVVGEENVGSPEILDTHRPDAFSLRKFGSSSPSPSGRGWREAPGEGSGHAPSSGPSGHLLPKGEGLALKRSLLLRLFRPPLEATVQLQQQIPIWIAFHGMHGPIVTANGPWRTSGDWWRPSMWDREEWDIEAADALYRIYYDVHLDRWYAQGAYD